MKSGKDAGGDLWSELHNQGDVDEDSYAAVPHLVRIATTWSRRDWNVYAQLSTIEVERQSQIPRCRTDAGKLAAGGAELLDLALNDLRVERDPLTDRSLLATVPLARGQYAVGTILGLWKTSELRALAEEKLGRRLPDDDEPGPL